MSARRAAVLILLGAALLTASYPPFRLPLLSFVALVPAVLLLEGVAGDAGAARRLGFWYGLATYGLVLHWLVVALWHFTKLAAVGYFAIIIVLGALTGTLFWFVTRLRAAFGLPLALLLPLGWTATEWLVGHIGELSFPWLGLGTSLADAPVLIQWADLAGARGVGVWLAWCSVVIGQALMGGGKGEWGRVVRRLVPVAMSVACAWAYGLWRERTIVLRDVGKVALVQPNIGFNEKWNEAEADSEVALLLSLSREARAVTRPDLVVWPEAAVPGYLAQRPGWSGEISRFAAESRTPLVTGGLNARWRTDGTAEVFNAAFYFDSLGRWQDYPVYAKHDLVPVVERVPFVPVAWFRALPWLGRWSGGFGHGRELPLYPGGAALGRFGVIICYESAFEDMPRRYRALGADFLVNVTNDAWYGRTAGPYQHATHLVVRAIETRLGVARAANSGISEFVDPLGRATAASQLETRTVVTGHLLTSDALTLYVRWGDWVGTLVMVAIVVLGAALFARDRLGWGRPPAAAGGTA